MDVRRPKRYTPEGWKYINSDGSLWPTDKWLPYSAKHPAPIPWDKVPDPSQPRTKVPLDLWHGEEEGHKRFLAIITIVRPIAEKAPVQQTHIYDFFKPKKDGELS